MSRVLGEAVDRIGEEVQVERGALGPLQFWRGQSRYLVGELLDSWMETSPWWQRDAGSGGASADLVAPREVWVTHGREDALIHECAKRGIHGRALRLVGYEEDDDAPHTGAEADAA